MPQWYTFVALLNQARFKASISYGESQFLGLHPGCTWNLGCQQGGKLVMLLPLQELVSFMCLTCLEFAYKVACKSNTP